MPLVHDLLTFHGEVQKSSRDAARPESQALCPPARSQMWSARHGFFSRYPLILWVMVDDN